VQGESGGWNRIFDILVFSVQRFSCLTEFSPFNDVALFGGKYCSPHQYLIFHLSHHHPRLSQNSKALEVESVKQFLFFIN